LGRRIGQTVYYGLVFVVAATATLQVAREAFLGEEQPAVPFATCREGLRELYAAVDRGRKAARYPADSEAPWSEEAALQRYREAVRPTWRHRDGVATMCQDAPELRAALDAIERLRYAEEHNVRSQAAELGPLRRRVRRIVRQRLTAEPAP
jgi:hypothetical protein